jgi:hypothetical protein
MMSDFSLADERRQQIEDNEARHKAAVDQRNRQRADDVAWAAAGSFEIGPILGLAQRLTDNGDAKHLPKLIAKWRAAHEAGNWRALPYVVILDVLRLAADPTTPRDKLAQQIAETVELWPNIGGDVDDVRELVRFHDVPDEPPPVPKSRPETAARKPQPKPAGEPVNGDEMKILESLARYYPETRTQEDLAADADLSVRTVADALKRLESVGLVCRPLGKKKGFALTDKGLAVARR